MIASLKAEYRKLITVRSTYVLSAVVLLIAAFLAGYPKGYRLDAASQANPGAMQDAMVTAIMITAVFSALIGMLIVTHEYRYSTILYSLTATKSRTVFLLSKVIVLSLFSVVLGAALMATAALSMWVGVQLADGNLVTQSVAYKDVIARSLFYMWGYIMIALLLGALIRNQIGAILTFFVVPSTVESALSLMLKDNAIYLPFSALGAVIDNSDKLSHGAAALVFIAYLAIGWLVTWVLFLRRDAN
jgi:ABC-2 type transport system permease protein